MMIEILKLERDEAIRSIQRYFRENFSDEVGDMPAGLLLNFFVEEFGPLIYNRAVADAQSRMEQRVMDLPGELYADGFQYWAKVDAKRKSRR